MVLNKKGAFFIALGVIIILSFLIGVGLFFGARAPHGDSEEERFVVSLGKNGDAVERLKEEGFLRSTFVFNLLQKGEIKAGGYRISKSMNAFELRDALGEGPYMEWVVVKEGVRKEEIAELLGEKLEWSGGEVARFILEDTVEVGSLWDGVFFPDTYLISKEDTPLMVAERLHNRFNEVFSLYLEEAFNQNIRWPTLVRIASLVERESAGERDAKLVAGILWNRLLDGKRLELDATIQYVRDTYGNYDTSEGELVAYTGNLSKERGWWTPIKIEDKDLDIFNANTYLNDGLPRYPIGNPGVTAIEAVLYPEETDCYFYLHDNEGDIHCSVTYEEHLDNIDRYLK